MLWNIGCFDINVFFKLFNAQIVPVLLYGSELLGCFDCPNVEKVHMYACKRILGLSSQSPNRMVYGELGRHHLPVLASTRCVKYWLRLNKLSSNRSVRMAYNMLKSMAEEGKENLASAVRDLLCTNGFAFAWWNGSVGDETRFLTEFQLRLKDCLIQNWHSRLESSGRYEVYRTFKSALEKEISLEVIQNQQIRKAFTRFRFGMSQILTHKRRYTDEDAVMLRCPLCNGETENEVHLLATCAWYDHIRQKYLSECFDLEFFPVQLHACCCRATQFQYICHVHLHFPCLTFKRRTNKHKLSRRSTFMNRLAHRQHKIEKTTSLFCVCMCACVCVCVCVCACARARAWVWVCCFLVFFLCLFCFC